MAKQRGSSWVKRIQQYFFGAEEKEGTAETDHHYHQSPASSTNNRESSSRLPESREPQTKMSYQYPKPAKFNFPMDVTSTSSEDNQILKRNLHARKEKSKEVEATTEEHENAVEEDQNGLFKGQNFAPQDIPSPVFGFQQQSPILNLDEETISNTKVSDEKAPLTPFPLNSDNQERARKKEEPPEEETYVEREEEVLFNTGSTEEAAKESLEVPELDEAETQTEETYVEREEEELFNAGSTEEAAKESLEEPELDEAETQTEETYVEREEEELFNAGSTEEAAKESLEEPELDEAETQTEETYVEREEEELFNAGSTEEAAKESLEEPESDEAETQTEETYVGDEQEGKIDTSASQFSEHTNIVEKHEEAAAALQIQASDRLQQTETEKISSEREKKALATEVSKLQAEASPENVEKTPFNVVMSEVDKQRLKKQQHQEEVIHSIEEAEVYQKPSLAKLNKPAASEPASEEELQAQQERLEATLQNFQVKAEVKNITQGPSVTRYEVEPAPGVKVSKVKNLTDDLKLALAAKELRIEAPIPGKSTIGIEVPNPSPSPVFLRDILSRPDFRRHESPLTVGLGKDISGEPVISDLGKMPHGLIAGATGSGKSVCINTILLSLLYKADPNELKLLLIDPKMVELASFRDVPHLAAPVVTDPKEATASLKWAVQEMENRYEKLAEAGVRDIKKYNEKSGESERMPYMVIVIDELADLMMVAAQDVEDAICRIAQKARACGIHLLVATQRPSVDVITGLIKANIPTRVAFAVSSQADSRTILDQSGAERLIGKGDMLFCENGTSEQKRIQGAFVSDEEIDAVTEAVKGQKSPAYLLAREQLVTKSDEKGKEAQDELYDEVRQFVIEQGAASSSLLQRRFHIGFNRAARLIDTLEASGIISPAQGSKPRSILVSLDDLDGRNEASEP
ncbi:DNA translocase FtsK [Salsuginibacillus halophilus]|uniref:DNA translocase FtsK n=1 Tax=Salsuginibacillus halophilus TaxID=517424 RepID=A0A2P8HEF0_9BACI|nr:DNA translocase FtsK [Salsuginibacillus halophilus]PSL44541.1 DNA translocase FtsK [Salsuginibacillus halophilus]